MKCAIPECDIEVVSRDRAIKSRQVYCSVKHRRKAINKRANQKHKKRV